MNALPAPRPADFETTTAGRRAVALLDSARGRFVSVTFTKRTTGERRTMTAIFSRRYLCGAWRFSPAAKGLLPVLDVATGTIKLIPLDAIESIRAKGATFSACFVASYAPPARPVPAVAAPSRPAVRRRTAAEAQAAARLLF